MRTASSSLPSAAAAVARARLAGALAAGARLAAGLAAGWAAGAGLGAFAATSAAPARVRSPAAMTRHGGAQPDGTRAGPAWLTLALKHIECTLAFQRSTTVML